MRLDKFLQLTGLVKRRTLAKALCEAGKVRLNGKVAKASSEVHEGDLIAAETGWESWQVQVKRLPKGSVPSSQRHEFIALLHRQRWDILSEEDEDLSNSQTP
jgi:ribosomal 50S subunit-recycling heat shock protein